MEQLGSPWRISIKFDIWVFFENLSRKFKFHYNVTRIKTHILCSITLFRKLYHLWDNVEKYGRAIQTTNDNTIRCMRFGCWITKATDTLRICNTYCFFTATMVTRTRLNVTLYIHCLSCYVFVWKRIFVEFHIYLSRVAEIRPRASFWSSLICMLSHVHIRVTWVFVYNGQQTYTASRRRAFIG
jgi:hypothetical protein